MFATNLFQDARLALRKKALEKCDQNPNLLLLLRSPFSENLFHDSVVKGILDNSRNFYQTMNVLLGFSGPHKRPASSSYRRPSNRPYYGTGQCSVQVLYQYSPVVDPSPVKRSMLALPGPSGQGSGSDQGNQSRGKGRN